MTILESGPVINDANVISIAKRLKDDGINEAVVANIDESSGEEIAAVSHYWVIEQDNKKLVYFGTPETFERWQTRQVN